jgi:hypothetical protein
MASVPEPIPDPAPDASDETAQGTSRRKLLKAGAATVFLGIPVVGALAPSAPAYAEPHPHCANTYVRFITSFCSTTACVMIYVYGFYCWDCGGQCGALIYEIDGPC